MDNGHLEITLVTGDKKVKYVFSNPNLYGVFDNLIWLEMIKLEGEKKIRLQEVSKIRE